MRCCSIGDSIVMLSEAIQEPVTSARIYLYVPNVDVVFDRAVAAGAQATMPVADMFASTEAAAATSRLRHV